MALLLGLLFLFVIASRQTQAESPQRYRVVTDCHGRTALAQDWQRGLGTLLNGTPGWDLVEAVALPPNIWQVPGEVVGGVLRCPDPETEVAST